MYSIRWLLYDDCSLLHFKTESVLSICFESGRLWDRRSSVYGCQRIDKDAFEVSEPYRRYQLNFWSIKLWSIAVNAWIYCATVVPSSIWNRLLFGVPVYKFDASAFRLLLSQWMGCHFGKIYFVSLLPNNNSALLLVYRAPVLSLLFKVVRCQRHHVAKENFAHAADNAGNKRLFYCWFDWY